MGRSALRRAAVGEEEEGDKDAFNLTHFKLIASLGGARRGVKERRYLLSETCPTEAGSQGRGEGMGVPPGLAEPAAQQPFVGNGRSPA